MSIMLLYDKLWDGRMLIVIPFFEMHHEYERAWEPPSEQYQGHNIRSTSVINLPIWEYLESLRQRERERERERERLGPTMYELKNKYRI